MLTYAGESAYLISHPGDHKNAFFKSVPQPVYWPVFVVATLAAIVASQSLITATFSLIKQCMSLGCFPRVKMVHTSPDKEGQVYSPEINYILMVLCVAVVLGFQDATQLGNAFGVAVVGVMFITTCFVTLVMILVWKLPFAVALLFLLVFGSIEGIYFTAVLNKVPQGGWVPFAMAMIFLAISLCWNYGRRRKSRYEMSHKISLDSVGPLLSEGATQRVPGICFFYSDLALGVPPIIKHYVKNVRTLHQVLVFTTIRFLPERTVPPEDRFFIGRVGFKGVYRCVAFYGYQDVIDCNNEEFRDRAIRSLQLYLENEERNEPDPNAKDVRTLSFRRTIADQNLEDLAELDKAGEQDAVYVVGKVTVRTSSSTGWFGRLLINGGYAFLRTICRSAIKELQIPPANYLEVGMLYEI
jgi:KUP system potassium uptake protein